MPWGSTCLMRYFRKHAQHRDVNFPFFLFLWRLCVVVRTYYVVSNLFCVRFAKPCTAFFYALSLEQHEMHPNRPGNESTDLWNTYFIMDTLCDTHQN